MKFATTSPALPAETHAFDVILEDGATASVRAYGRGPRVICSHGNGLAADAFQSFWRLFVDDYQTVVFDFRHHGRSSPYRGAIPKVWPQLIRDYDAIMRGITRELGAAPSLGAFHSMSALTTLLHASEYESPWIGIVGFNLVGTGIDALAGFRFNIDTGLIAAISIFLMTIVFGILMRAPTIQGRKVMDEIDGFKMYLETAEKNRLNISTEPPMSIDRFERILPYAIALGV